MKTLFYSILTLCSLTAFGQEKTYSFDKKVSYKINLPDEYRVYLEGQKELLFVTYITKDAVLGTSEGGPYVSGSFNKESFFIHNNRFFDVYANSLENQLSIKAPYYYEGVSEDNLKPYSDNLFEKFVSVKNLNSSATINGYTCNEYELTSKTEFENKTSTLCIDEKNAINNVAIMFPQIKLKGLLVRYDAGDFNGLTIQNIANSNVKVTFDEKKEIENFTNEIAKKKLEYDNLMAAVDSTSPAAAYTPDNRYEDPIINYYTYQTSDNNNINNLFGTIASLNYSLVYTDNDYDGNPDIDRSAALSTAQGSTTQLIKQFKKNKLANKSEVKELNNLFKTYFDDAKKFKLTEVSSDYEEAAVAVDSAVSAVSMADYYDPYISAYKTTDINTIDLAIDNPNVQDFMKIAPEHCKDLKTKIPTFTDKELGNLVYNYTGQVCDLYIYQSGSVGLPETIDAMRKSVLEINNKYDKLKKDDKEKLATFLNSLD
ncbi:hypothetical protein ACNFNZ_07045 [Empedobacter brevis]|uniref:hypothetical protein n=1 Tax=Empedobacter brevis TaxID=247 RepID=UPI0023F37BE8|nr:hypothetical protein [Empedobacter brevis]